MSNTIKEKLINNERLDFLDGLRGIFSLLVVFAHCIYFAFDKPLGTSQFPHLANIPSVDLLYKIVFLFCASIPNVFFVMSGFVLSYGLAKGKDNSLIVFGVKRVFRIVPLYLVVFLLAFFCNQWIDISIKDFTEELLLFPNKHKLLMHGWYISHELCFSFLVPFIFLLMNKKYTWFLALIFLLLFLSHEIIDIYAMHFLLGALLCRFYINGFPAVSKKMLYFFLLIALPIYLLQGFNMGFPTIANKINELLSLVGIKLYDFERWAGAIGSFILMCALFNNKKIQQVISNKYFLFLGKYSYGIYIIHWLPLCLIFYFYGIEIFENDFYFGVLTLFLLTISITVVTAYLLHFLIELPFVKLGKKYAPFCQEKLQNVSNMLIKKFSR